MASDTVNSKPVTNYGMNAKRRMEKLDRTMKRVEDKEKEGLLFSREQWSILEETFASVKTIFMPLDGLLSRKAGLARHEPLPIATSHINVDMNTTTNTNININAVDDNDNSTFLTASGSELNPFDVEHQGYTEFDTTATPTSSPTRLAFPLEHLSFPKPPASDVDAFDVDIDDAFDQAASEASLFASEEAEEEEEGGFSEEEENATPRCRRTLARPPSRMYSFYGEEELDGYESDRFPSTSYAEFDEEFDEEEEGEGEYDEEVDVEELEEEYEEEFEEEYAEEVDEEEFYESLFELNDLPRRNHSFRTQLFEEEDGYDAYQFLASPLEPIEEVEEECEEESDVEAYEEEALTSIDQFEAEFDETAFEASLLELEDDDGPRRQRNSRRQSFYIPSEDEDEGADYNEEEEDGYHSNDFFLSSSSGTVDDAFDIDDMFDEDDECSGRSTSDSDSDASPPESPLLASPTELFCDLPSRPFVRTHSFRGTFQGEDGYDTNEFFLPPSTYTTSFEPEDEEEDGLAEVAFETSFFQPSPSKLFSALSQCETPRRRMQPFLSTKGFPFGCGGSEDSVLDNDEVFDDDTTPCASPARNFKARVNKDEGDESVERKMMWKALKFDFDF